METITNVVPVQIIMASDKALSLLDVIIIWTTVVHTTTDWK